MHPNWVFKINRTYDEQSLRAWTEPNYTKSESWEDGENGSAFTPISAYDEVEMKKLFKVHKYNIYASDEISLRRVLPDYRYGECYKLKYPDRLPNISAILVMHNEAKSLVLRTVHSIIDRSPRELIHEIIIVDDASTWDSLKQPMDDYIKTFPVSVRILRNTQREGLIRARLIGALNATVD